jgi:hypothetical protein
MLNQVISLFCLSIFSNSYQGACNNATQAYTIQSGLQTDYGRLEGYLRAKGDALTDQTVGKPGVVLGAATYGLVIHKKIVYTVPTKIVADSTKIEGNLMNSSISLNLGWSFDRIFGK